MIHHNFKKGKKVLIIFKDGSKYIDKYLDTKSTYLVLKNRIILFSDIRSATIWKE